MQNLSSERDVTRVRVRMSRPENWNVEATRGTDVGILCKGVFGESTSRPKSLSTIYGKSNEAIRESVATIRDSPAVYSVTRVNLRSPGQQRYPPDRTSQTYLVEYDESNHISDVLIERGFVLGEPIRTQNAIENWVLLASEDRDEIETRISEVSSEADVNIDIRGIGRPDGFENGSLPVDTLSPRQREVFQLAREQGYYATPAKSTANELAAQLDISTSTLHEHLHKAEEKLLDLSAAPGNPRPENR